MTRRSWRRAEERVAARRRAVEAAESGEDEGTRGVEAGAAKTRWHGGKAAAHR